MQPTDSQLESQTYDSEKPKSVFNVRNTAIAGVGILTVASVGGGYCFRDELLGNKGPKDDTSLKASELEALNRNIAVLSSDIKVAEGERNNKYKELDEVQDTVARKAEEKKNLEKNLREKKEAVAKLKAEKSKIMKQINGANGTVRDLKEISKNLNIRFAIKKRELEAKIKSLNEILPKKI